MGRRENDETGPFDLFTLTVAAIAIGLTWGAIMLMPAEAVSGPPAASDAGPVDDVSRAKGIEPKAEM